VNTAFESRATSRHITHARVVQYASLVFCAALPAVAVAALFAGAMQDDAVAFDFRPIHRAAEQIVDGVNPYPGPRDALDAASGPYVYPPLPAIASIPLSLLSFEAAGLLLMALLVLTVAATLAVLGVRDWRCYGVAFLWPPVLSAVQTGNVTIVLGLCAALAWRFRGSLVGASASVAVTLAL
jgi:hypothetical protein